MITLGITSMDTENNFLTPHHLLVIVAMFEVIHQTRETVFRGDVQTTRRELKIRRAVEYLQRNSRYLDSQQQCFI